MKGAIEAPLTITNNLKECIRHEKPIELKD
jgi:hypothetical protein